MVIVGGRGVRPDELGVVTSLVDISLPAAKHATSPTACLLARVPGPGCDVPVPFGGIATRARCLQVLECVGGTAICDVDDVIGGGRGDCAALKSELADSAVADETSLASRSPCGRSVDRVRHDNSRVSGREKICGPGWSARHRGSPNPPLPGLGFSVVAKPLPCTLIGIPPSTEKARKVGRTRATRGADFGGS